MRKITASIVVYKNDLTVLERTLQSFFSSSLKGQLFIIDNSPADKVRELCLRFEATYIFNGDNIGFGKAHNIALEQCIDGSSYHLVLNPDVFFDAHVLEELYDFMEQHPEAGLVMPKVLSPDGNVQNLCKLLPGPMDLFVRRFFPFKSWFKKMNDSYEMIASGYNKVMNVPFLSGCFMFLRTSVLKETGLFDERFFLYAEDADLSRRIHLRAKTLFYPYVSISHIHARGSYKTLGLTWQNARSAVLYFNKWGWFFDSERTHINRQAEANMNRNCKEVMQVNSIEMLQETVS